MPTLLDYLSRSPRLLWASIYLSIGVLFVLFSYYVLGLGRDDLYQTRQLNDQLSYTAPITTHASSKEYKLFIHSRDVPGNFSPTSTPVAAPSPDLSITSAVTGATTSPGAAAPAAPSAKPLVVIVAGATGVVLLPDQTRILTFTPGLYQSFSIAYVAVPTAAHATIALRTADGATLLISLPREQAWQTFLRRLIAEPIGGSVLTTLIPFVFVLLGVLVAQQEASLRNQVKQAEDQFKQLTDGRRLIAPRDAATLEVGLQKTLPSIRRSAGRLQRDDRKRFEDVDFLYKHIYPLLKALRKRHVQEIDGLLKTIGDPPALDEPQYTDILNLIKDMTNPDYPGAPRLSPETPFVHERLAFLAYKRHLDSLPRETIEAFIKAVERRTFQMEPDMLVSFQSRLLTIKELIPPAYPAEDKLYLPLLKIFVPHIPHKSVRHVLQVQPQPEILLISGAARSGKSTALSQLQSINRIRGILYLAPMRAADLVGELLLPTITAAINTALLAILQDKPRLFHQLNNEPQSLRGEITRTLAGSHADADDDQLEQLLDRARAVSRMDQLKLDRLCIAVDDAALDFDYPLIRRQITQATGKDVLLRVVIGTPVSQPREYQSITLSWAPEDIEEIYHEIMSVEGWRFDWIADHDRQALFQPQIAGTPYELIVWIYVLYTRYQGADITQERWRELYAAMQAARRHRSPEATDWRMDDAQDALQALKR